ncbi:MAG: ATP-binding cassette domain-containing protein [Chitinivibrionales bacterium]|nr:ATP-binding cassette domain-containing protein [Chitinivibrionales bacterium]
MQYAIEFNSASVIDGPTVLLKNITFSVPHGGKALITGPTGSGKSSVLLALMGAYPVVNGTVYYDGTPVTSETVSILRKSIGYIAQEPVLGEGTVREGLLMPFTFRANRSRAPSETAIHDAFDRLQLPRALLDRDISLVSGGEKQRIAIARTLLLGKNVFVVDEITSALDEASNSVVLDLFTQSRATVLAVSHHPRWSERFDMRIKMERGAVTTVTDSRKDGNEQYA